MPATSAGSDLLALSAVDAGVSAPDLQDALPAGQREEETGRAEEPAERPVEGYAKKNQGKENERPGCRDKIEEIMDPEERDQREGKDVREHQEKDEKCYTDDHIVALACLRKMVFNAAEL